MQINSRSTIQALIVSPMLFLGACSGGGDSTGPGQVVPVLSSISVSAIGSTSITPGNSIQLSALSKDASGALFNTTVTWSSSNTAAATVSSSGLVLGIAAGTAAISARSGAIVGTINVFVGSGSFPLTQDIDMPGLSFSPLQSDIAQGGVVRFNFPALQHNVVFNAATGAPANIPVSSSTTISRTFNAKGTFNYTCTLHSGMSAVIIVH